MSTRIMQDGREYIFVDDKCIGFNIRPLDPEGNPVERTKSEFPYSFDTYVVWRNMPSTKDTSAVYMDRLYQWDHELTSRLTEKHGLRYLSDITVAKAQAFLRERLDKPNLVVCYLAEACHQATGYPIWLFGFNSN